MEIENCFSNDFWSTFVDSINFSIAAYPVYRTNSKTSKVNQQSVLNL